MLRHPPRERSIWIRPNPEFTEPITPESVRIPPRRSSRWKPLGLKNHIPSDPMLFKLASFLGKSVLMDYVRSAADSDLVVVKLIELWDRLTSSGRRTVTLTDLCHAAGVTRAQFVSATVRGCCQVGDCCVLLALQRMKLPKDVEEALSEFFV